jgi:hypothetical protein
MPLKSTSGLLLSALFLILSTSSSMAQGEPPFSYSCLRCRPADVLVDLSRRFRINIVFNEQILSDCPRISIQVRGESLPVLLKQIAACSGTAFRLVAGQVVFYKKTETKTLSGFVRDAETGEQLIGVVVRIATNPTHWTLTNEFGFFSLVTDVGDSLLLLNSLGYKTLLANISTNRLMNLAMRAATRLPEVVVVGQTPAFSGTEGGLGSPKEIPRDLLNHLPVPGGEPDVVRLSALLPGVKTGVDGLGGLHIRGGNADQNLFLMDDVPVYNPGHGLGLLSVFNSALVSSMHLWKGDFPARYSGRLSSVMDIRTRDGNLKTFHSSVSMGLFAANVTTEGPIIKGKSSFLLAGRFSYFQPWVRLLAQQGNLFNLSAGRANYRFFDGNAKFNYAISDRTKIYLSLYKGGDAFRNAYGKSYPTQRDTVTDLSAQTSDWGNEIAALRWNQVWRKNLFSNTTLRYSRYQYNSDFNFRSTQQGASGSIRVLADYAQLYQTRIRDYSGKTDFTWYAKNRYQVKFGGSLTNHRFQPGALSANLLQPAPLEGYLDSLKTVLVSNERIGALETEIYIDATIGLGLGWRADIGCNYTSFGSESTRSYSFQPRIKLTHTGAEGWKWWSGAYRNSQFLHQIGTFNISLPFELWVPSTANVLPEHSWLVSAGGGWSGRGWTVAAEWYYKHMNSVLYFIATNEALYTGGAEDASGWEDRIANGSGWGRVLELTLEKTAGRLTAALAYTWSVANRQFDEINSGKPFPFRYDRRHDFNIRLAQQLTPHISISGIWTYATGSPITLAAVKFTHETPESLVQRDVLVYTDVNGYRLPPYHRLDLSLNGNITTSSIKHTVQLGVFNTYNRANPFFLYVDTNSPIKGRAIQYTLLPILPSLRYGIQF